MTDPNRTQDLGDREPAPPADWSAGWESQEIATLEASLAATPAQRLEWLEEAIEIAWASGALPRE
jgi:hypothetical protein